jgi:hypothetical protein
MRLSPQGHCQGLKDSLVQPSLSLIRGTFSGANLLLTTICQLVIIKCFAECVLSDREN